MIVCRAFDWRNDPRLRRLVPAAAAQIEVARLGRDRGPASPERCRLRARVVFGAAVGDPPASTAPVPVPRWRRGGVERTDLHYGERSVRPLLDQQAAGGGEASRTAAGRVDDGRQGPLRRDGLHPPADRAGGAAGRGLARVPAAPDGRRRRQHRPAALRVRARDALRLLRRPSVVQPAGIADRLAHRLGAAPGPPGSGQTDAVLPPGRGADAVRARTGSPARPQGRPLPHQGPGIRGPGRGPGPDRAGMDALGAVARPRVAGPGAGID